MPEVFLMCFYESIEQNLFRPEFAVKGFKMDGVTD
jgi:hypothetical protein